MNQKSYLYIFVSISAGLVFFILGFFIFSPKEIQVGQENQSQIPSSNSNLGSAGSDASCLGGSCPLPEEENGKSFTGRVEKTGASIVQQGTHQLEDENGKVIAYLRADDDKLEMVEGMKVEVRGKVQRTVEGNFPLVLVEEVRFK